MHKSEFSAIRFASMGVQLQTERKVGEYRMNFNKKIMVGLYTRKCNRLPAISWNIFNFL